MPQFDLRGIKCARYVNTSGTISYTNPQAVGDAMEARIELRFAEGRLYAESSLAEYIRKCVGGTVSLGVKYIKDSAQKLMFGLNEKARTITYMPAGGSQAVTKSVTSLVTKKNSSGSYVGIVFYSPDMVDGVQKFTCVFLPKCMFGQPAMSLQTAGENIQFNTPTTTGEFLADESADGNIQECVVVDSEEEASAWCDGVFA